VAEHRAAPGGETPPMQTTFERGFQLGFQLGFRYGFQLGFRYGLQQWERATALRQLEARFGSLAPAVRQRVEALAPEELRHLLIDLLKAQSLKELRLED